MLYKIGDKVKVKKDNDNENYKDFKDKILIITSANNEGYLYDESMFPEGLYTFITESGKEIPFCLYDYEIIKINSEVK